MKLYQFISFKQSPRRLLPFCGYIIVFIFIVLFIYELHRETGPWIPKTKTLSSLKDLPLELPANFADFPSEGQCTWSILSHGNCDVLWGKHTGLQDVAEWRVAFHVTQGITPQFTIDPEYAIPVTTPVTSDEVYDLIKRQVNSNAALIDLGFFNPRLKTIKGTDIARLSSERKFIMCWVNEEIFVFVFHLY
jgi:hypothetical protein